MKKSLLILLFIPALLNCSVASNKENLKDVGIFGQHELRRIEQIEGINGKISGNFFLGCGSLAGNITNERRLQFSWGRTPDEFIVTTLPFSMFRFVIDDSKKVPTVEFIFDKSWLDSKWHNLNESEKSNPNSWLDDEYIRNHYFRVAIVRISKQDFEKEVFLPK